MSLVMHVESKDLPLVLELDNEKLKPHLFEYVTGHMTLVECARTVPMLTFFCLLHQTYSNRLLTHGKNCEEASTRMQRLSHAAVQSINYVSFVLHVHPRSPTT